MKVSLRQRQDNLLTNLASTAIALEALEELLIRKGIIQENELMGVLQEVLASRYANKPTEEG